MQHVPASNTNEPRYWDSEDLIAEQRRQYDLCHGCRLCWNLCPVFPDLFDLTDSVQGEMEQISAGQFSQIESNCFQCKLCWVVCPYTSPHEYNLDVPRMIARSKFVRAKNEGVKFSKKIIADQDRLAKLAGGALAPFTNFANSFPPTRIVSELVLDINRNAKLPEYKTQTFSTWFNKHYGTCLKPSDNPVKKIAFFPSCTIDYNDTQIGKAAISVLAHNNVEVILPDHQCCGMPLMDIGEYDKSVDKMNFNLNSLSALIDQGYEIVVAQPTCTLVMREDYPQMSENKELSQKVAMHTMEIGTFLTQLAREKLLNRDFKKPLGKIAFHVACHTRAQAMGINSPRLLGIIPDTQVDTSEYCSGHDGSWGVGKKTFPIAIKIGEKLFNNLSKSSPDLIVSDCPLAARHIEIGTGIRPIHTVQALAAAYGLSGEQ